MTADQIIEVLQAWKEGKQIEWKFHGHKEWSVWIFRHSPEDFFRMEYRVKPEQRKPREFWIHLKVAADWTAFGSLADAERAEKESIYAITERVHVREVMEDERPTETEDNRKVWLKNDLVEQDYASLSVLPNYDHPEDGGFGYFYYASDLRKHPELRKYVIGG